MFYSFYFIWLSHTSFTSKETPDIAGAPSRGFNDAVFSFSRAGRHACTHMYTHTFLILVLVLYRFLWHTTWPEQFKDHNVSTVSMRKGMVTMCLQSVCRNQESHCIYSQYAKSDECRASAHFFLSSQFKHPTYGMVLLKPRVNFPLKLT